MYKIISKIIVLVVAVLFAVACDSDELPETNDGYVRFSVDTVCFDTLFAENTSYTRTFLVRNYNKEAISFDRIVMGGGSGSNFRFNVDGIIPNDANEVKGIDVLAGDSLYVFVETTVPSDDAEVNLLVEDSLVFYYGNKVSKVHLQAVGKTATVMRNYSIAGNTSLTAAKPYLVMGYLHVPEGLKLTINEGVELYMGAGANIIVDGDLSIEGTVEKPVKIRGSRFDNVDDSDETPYENLPSQWGNVYLQNPSGKHVIDNVRMMGMSLGVLLVGTSRMSPKLEIRNSVIRSSGGYGVYSQNGALTIENTEISNCAMSCLYVVGGELTMVHSTIANYFKYGARTTAACRIANYAQQGVSRVYFPVTSAVVENSIIFGANSTEISLENDLESGVDYNVLLSYNLIKAKKDERIEYRNNIWANSQNGTGKDTVFVSVDSDIDKVYDFRLDSLSNAISKANRIVAERYPMDMLGVSRLDDEAPDLGAYERKN